MPTSLSDGITTKQFPLNPDVKMSISGEFASNSVLDTVNPQVRSKYSAKTYKLERILLYSFSGRVDQTPLINTIQQWASSQKMLRFYSDIYGSDSCFISSLELEVKQWTNNQVWAAEMSLELIESLTGAVLAPKQPNKKVTPREQLKLKKTVEDKLKKPSNRKVIGLESSILQVAVTDNEKVTITSEDRTLEFDYDSLNQQLT